MADSDTFLQENLANWFTNEYQESFDSLNNIGGQVTSQITLENIHFWLTNGQMIRYLNRIYQPEFELFSSIPAYQTRVTAINDYKEKLRSGEIDELNLSRFPLAGALPDMIRATVEQYAEGDDNRIQAVYALMSASMLLDMTTPYYDLPQWNDIGGQPQHELLLEVCPKREDCGFKVIDANWAPFIPIFLSKINQLEIGG